jgi:Rad3-related DNA helicase
VWSPQELGFPEWFEEFRPAQEEAIEHCLTTEKRFVGIGAPPGVGKSGIAYAIAKLLGGRTIILTGTLGLQDQYAAYPDIVDIRGRSNFPCWESGTCEDGGRMGCGDKVGCPYLGAFKRQNEAEIVVTSYAYYLACHEKGQGMRPPDTLICDEAGLADQWLSRALDFTISERECRDAGIRMAPPPGEDLDGWVERADRIWSGARSRYATLKLTTPPRSGGARDRLARDLRKAESFVDRSERLAKLDDNWVCSREDGHDEGRVWRFECIWPGKYREKLFRWVPRVILMSATLRPKTLNLLGIARADCDFREWGRQFPAANGPVIWVPTVRLNHRMSNEDRERWMCRIGEIVEKRDDRRGLIHTVSYARAKEIASSTLALSYPIILNGAADPDTQTARQAFEQHVKSKHSNSVLVSPSFSTGWDFAGTHAEYQIIAKLPLPDTRSKVMQARVERDRGYADYLAAQELVQACGRVVRSATDRGETIIIDDSLTWFKNRAAEHMPKWYRIRKEETLPPALPKIT